MRYFTPALWLGMQKRGTALRNALRTWDANWVKYQAQLRRLRPRLSNRAYRFFTKVSLHDGHLLAYALGDGLSPSRRARVLNRGYSPVPVVTIGVLAVDDWEYELRYTDLRAASSDYPGQPLFARPGGPIDDWGYDELTSASRTHLKHEILFASGTTITIVFGGFSYSRRRPGRAQRPN